MSASPSWLTTSAPAPAAAAPAVDPLSIEPSTDAPAGTSSSTDEKDLPSIILMMRLLNMGAAAGLITVSVRTNGLVTPHTSEGHFDRSFRHARRENTESGFWQGEVDIWHSVDLSAVFASRILITSNH